jgi:uncharacterized protein (DUF1501 family)
MMKRRRFLHMAASFTALPLALGGQPLYALGRNLFLQSLASLHPDRILVLVQLNGGNDGLNTLVPMDQYSHLASARPNLILPENKVLALEGDVGLHPSLERLRQMYIEEKVLFIQGVGYPEPNFSHFRSKDIITSASDAGVVLHTGWMGRMLQDIHPAYPGGYPNAAYPHPLALTVGSTNSPTCQGTSSNLGTVIQNLKTQYQTGGTGETFPDTPFGNEMEFLTEVMRQTEVYLEVIGQAADAGNNLSAGWPEAGENKLADQLKVVAHLISGGLKTQVYVVSLGGFDTHSGQVITGAPETGTHASLLEKVAEGLQAFQDDLSLLGLEDRVLGFVFSEFGRRIKSNASLGSDHGAAWPAMLFGSRVNPAILGNNPQIPENVGKKDNLPMQYDFRSVYGSILRHWFEVDEVSIRNVLFQDFESLDILKRTTSDGPDLPGKGPHKPRGLQIRGLFPNPASDRLLVDFISGGEPVSLNIFSMEGRKIRSMDVGRTIPGKNNLTIDLSDLSTGHYTLILQSGQARHSQIFSVVKNR